MDIDRLDFQVSIRDKLSLRFNNMFFFFSTLKAKRFWQIQFL